VIILTREYRTLLGKYAKLTDTDPDPVADSRHITALANLGMIDDQHSLARRWRITTKGREAA